LSPAEIRALRKLLAVMEMKELLAGSRKPARVTRAEDLRRSLSAMPPQNHQPIRDGACR
jgi:hypothetical protein